MIQLLYSGISWKIFIKEMKNKLIFVSNSICGDCLFPLKLLPLPTLHDKFMRTEVALLLKFWSSTAALTNHPLKKLLYIHPSICYHRYCTPALSPTIQLDSKALEACSYSSIALWSFESWIQLNSELCLWLVQKSKGWPYGSYS